MQRLTKSFAPTGNRTKEATTATADCNGRLAKPLSRQHRREVQQLLDPWNVPQKSKGRKRKCDEVKAALVAKVVEETRRVKRMQDASETPSPDESTTTSVARFSAI